MRGKSNAFMNMEAGAHEMILNQMGAEVTQINSKCCHVKFYIDDIKLSYVYNINKSDNYFLERLKPYPLPLKEYNKEEDVIETIRIDLEQFQNAAHSKNIKSFIQVNQELAKTAKAFEDLFLYYNVEKFHTETILQKIDEIKMEILKTVNDSDRIYHDSEPNYLKYVLKSDLKKK